MAIEGFEWTDLTETQTDSGSEHDINFWEAVRENLYWLYLSLGGSYTPIAEAHTHNGVDSEVVSAAEGGVHVAVGHFLCSDSIKDCVDFCNFTPDAVLVMTTDNFATHSETDNCNFAVNNYTLGAFNLYGSTSRFGTTTTPYNARGLGIELGGFEHSASSDVVTNGSRGGVIAFKEGNGGIAVNGYTGDDANPRDITGLGFDPEFVLIARASTVGTAAVAAVVKSPGFPTNTALYLDGGTQSTAVTLITDGFRVSNSGETNASGAKYVYLALDTFRKNGERVVRLAHIALASGSYPIPVDIGFTPQAIIGICYVSSGSDYRRFWIATSQMDTGLVHASTSGASSRLLSGFCTITEDGAILGSNISTTVMGSGAFWEFFFIKGGTVNAFHAL